MGKVRLAVLTLTAAILGLVGVAGAQPQVEIVSPIADTCVNNGDTIFEDGVVGGLAQPPKRDFTVDLRLSDAAARSVLIDLEISTPVNRPPLPAPVACNAAAGGNATCAAATEGTCLFNNTCGCFGDADCQGGAHCNDNRCGCVNNNECGAGNRCLADGRCGCNDNSACAAGEACTLEGVCTCDADSDCLEGQACADGVCAVLENTQFFSIDPGPVTAVPAVVQVAVGGELIPDAERKFLRAFARAGNDVASDEVGFKLDREVPIIQLTDDFQASNAACQATAPALGNNPPNGRLKATVGTVLDGLDPNPQVVSIDQTTDGCELNQRILVRDSCNNRQRLRLGSRRRPVAGEVSVAVNAYRCDLQSCATVPANLLANGARTIRGTATYTVTAPAGCTNAQTFNDAVDGGVPRTLIQGTLIQTTPALIRGFVGPFNMADGQTLQLAVDGGANQTVTFRASEVQRINAVTIIEAIRIINQQTTGLIADVNLGLEVRTTSRGRTASIRVVGGAAANSLGLPAGSVVNGDGDGLHTVTAQISACANEPVANASISFTILDRPVADAGGPYEAVQGAALQLSAAASFAAPEAGGITEYAWDLDNDGSYEIVGGAAAARTVPFNTAQGDGLYRVFLRVTAGDGTSEFTSALVNVTDVNPVCNLGGAAIVMGVEGETVSLNGSASAPGHPSDPIIAYDWDFGDGQFPQRGDGLSRVNHQFPNQGDFTVRLRVEDQDSFAECTRVVRITDISPIVRGVAAFTPDALFEGTAVRFTAGETAPGSAADPLQDLQWNFGDGTVINGLDRNPQHVYANNGTFNVCLTVSDEDSQAAPFCFDVVIRDLQPEPAFTGEAFGNEGSLATFDATNTIPGGAADLLSRLVWNFGDGTPEVTVNNPAAPGSRVVTHTFAASGTFQVRLTAFDEDSSASVTREFLVYDVQPTARARVAYVNAEQVGFEGVPLTLDASASTPGSPTDPIATYRWNFGDGSAEMETAVPTVQHTWPNEGAYPASVTVVDSDGSESAVSLQVNIENVAPTNARIVGPAQIEVGETAIWRVEYTDVAADIPPASTRWTVAGIEASTSLSFESSLGGLGTYVIGVVIADGAGGSTTAQLSVEVTPAAPRIETVGPFTVREGQALAFDVRVTPALRNDQGEYDGPVRILVSRLPEGASYSETAEIVGGVETTVLHFDWLPTYYDAGTTQIHIVAEGRFNPTSRAKDVEINVTEGGNPVLAAAGGTGRRGQVTLFDYARTAGTVSFTARARVDVGIGAAGVVSGPDGRYVFVASPGSGGVAVVGVKEAALLRMIPTGSGTRALVAGGDFIWAIDDQVGNLTVIDPVTLKVEAQVRLGINRPLDLAWLPAGFTGVNAPRIAVVAGDGTLNLIDPDAVLDEMPAILSQASLGGALNRVIADVAAGDLVISDAKTRMVYRVSGAALEDSPGNLDAHGTRLVFAATDLSVSGTRIIAATDAGLMVVDGAQRTAFPAVRAVGIALLPPGIIAGGEVVVSTADRVENLNGELTRIIDAAGGRVRRLAAFIAFE